MMSVSMLAVGMLAPGKPAAQRLLASLLQLMAWCGCSSPKAVQCDAHVCSMLCAAELTQLYVWHILDGRHGLASMHASEEAHVSAATALVHCCHLIHQSLHIGTCQGLVSAAAVHAAVGNHAGPLQLHTMAVPAGRQVMG